MDRQHLRALLASVADGSAGIDAALDAIARPADADLGFARLDLERAERTGHPEVIFGQGKTPEQITALLARLVASGQEGMVTRIDADKAARVRAALPEATYHDVARVLTLRSGEHPPPQPVRGRLAIVCAGTSDLPVAEEAAVVAEAFGNPVDRVWDVGVAGLHRVVGRLDVLQRASVIIVIAGMEGALASVVAGLVRCPVIAVPTSVGYGASFGGLAALLGMLNSCAAGVSVVNIDNGFGAAVVAARMNRADPEPRP